MKIVSLSVEGFGSFQHRTELDLSDVSVCAVTGSNGSGKSTLFDAVLWAMFGTVPGRSTAEVINDESTEATVVVEVLCDNEILKFSRFKSSARSSVVDATLTTADGTMISGARPVSKEAERLLNCSHDLLTLTALSRQGDVGRFGSMDAGSRRSALTKALLLGHFTDDLAEVTESLERYKITAVGVSGDLSRLTTDADRYRTAKIDLAAVQRTAEQAETALATAAASSDDLGSVHRELVLVNDAIERVETAKRRAAATATKLAAAETQAEHLTAQLNTTERTVRELNERYELHRTSVTEASATASAARQAADGADERIDLLERGDNAECWVCGSSFDGHDLNEMIAELQRLITKADETTAAATQTKRTAAACRTDLTETESALQQRRQQSIEAARRVDALHHTLEQTNRELNETTADYTRRNQLQQLLDAAVDDDVLAAAKRHHNHTQQALGAAQTRYDTAKQAVEQLPAQQTAYETAQNELRGMTLLRKALSPGGIPHMALEAHVNELGETTNDVLRSLGGSNEIRFVLEDLNKANRPLSIESRNTAFSPWRNYHTFSGGERAKIDIALRVALTIATGVRCKTLVLDEGEGALDPEATIALGRFLSRLTSTSPYIDSVFAISHTQAAVDEFEHRIEVTKTVTGSHATLTAN